MTEFQMTTRPSRERALFYYSQNHNRKRRSTKKGLGKLKSKGRMMKMAVMLLLVHVGFFLTFVDVQSTQAFELVSNFIDPKTLPAGLTIQEHIAMVNVLADKVAIVAMPIVIALGAYMAFVFAQARETFSNLLSR